MIDRFLPEYQFREVHGTLVGAPVLRVDAAVRSLDLGRSPLVRGLFALRGMPANALRLPGLERIGFTVLADVPGDELVLGLIGRFWSLDGALQCFAPADFTAFREPGYAKAAWNFRMQPAGADVTRLETETRVLCTDAASRKRFGWYWRLIRPFSGLIRREALRCIRRDAERVAAIGLAVLLAACAVRAPSGALPALPARAPSALTGSAFIASIESLPRDEREAAILRELLAGNIPSHLRELRTVEVSDAQHTIRYEVMPDYLAIGSDDDFVRMPMNPYTAQAFCDAFGFVLPTRKMVDDIWAAATIHLEPRPLTEEREAPRTFLQHHRIIEAQLAAAGQRGFVGGIKKDVASSNKLQERPGRVAIYGWHYPDGRPIQPLYAGHVDWYVDYSHGIRPVRRWLLVDGVRRPFEEILVDPRVLGLLSDEGAIPVPRYQRPGSPR